MTMRIVRDGDEPTVADWLDRVESMILTSEESVRTIECHLAETNFYLSEDARDCLGEARRLLKAAAVEVEGARECCPAEVGFSEKV
jgi:hypothetical protein